MYIVQNQYISDEIADEFFVCDLHKCKGACCVEGDMGAPLLFEELDIMEKIYPLVKPYLPESGVKAIEKQGEWLIDEDNDYSTPLVEKKHCAYTIFENGTAKCGIEKAFLDGKIDFRKPVSCHLYPIRVSEYEQFEALNYSRWEICSPACVLGRELKVEIYKFLEAPLVRKYGQAWYEELCRQIEERKQEKKQKNSAE